MPTLRVFAALTAAAVLPAALAGQTPAQRADSIFAGQRGTDRPGCAVSVLQRGREVFAKGYGMADLAQGLAITPNSIFHVASVSKEFTAMNLVLLAQAGRISLDDEIHRYLPELPDYGTPITIRHLLTHTGGIRDQWNLLISAGWRLGDDLITEQDVLDIVTAQRSLNFTPGSDWLYSNSGFSLAAIIVKRVTGRSLREFADSALFRPLGMRHTHFHDDNGMIVPGRTRGFTFRDGIWKETVPNYSTVGATSLFTTVTDLARWHAQLDSGLIGGPRAIAELTRPAVLTTGDTLGYALGIAVGRYRGARTVSHSGGDPGYATHLLHFPATGSGVTVLCNTSGVVNPSRLAEQLADAFLGDELGPPVTPPPQIGTAAIADGEGLYWAESSESVARLVIDKGLAFWRTGNLATGGAPLREGGADRVWLVNAAPATLTRRPDGSLLFRSANGESAGYRKVESWTPSPADRAALAGRYYSPEVDVTWEIRAAGDSLLLHRRKFPPAALAPAFRDTYLGAGGGMVVRVIRGPDGRIAAITAGSGRVRRLRFDRR